MKQLRREGFYMTSMSKKADLFDKAIVDLWLAKIAVDYRADATILNWQYV